MFEGRRVLVVVPARGGSKGVKLKNLREVGGVPLVALAGHVAKALPWVDRAIVSTDHEGIAKVAEEAGLACPFLRPEDISGAIISDWQVLIHALTEMERIDAVTYDVVIMLQPTSPGRTPEHVTATMEHLVKGGFDAVWTLSETDSKAHPLKQLNVSPEGGLSYYDPAGAKIIARQQLTPVHHRNGIAYAITRQCLVDQKSIMGAKPGAVVVEGNLPNIDTELDLDWANFLIARGKD
ncbi:MAG: acylneuraminate cytidylyltransferase family protein [Aestuariivirga sp.]|uniref:acylneuraminate cytidylyltransferase family protein n=1 Tax=Aestuariivirga sp. TaxID=2650926 RepID=UPI00301B246D